MTDEAPEESTVKSPDKLKITLIVTFLILCVLVTIVCLSMTLYLSLSKPTEPKTLIIYGYQTDPAIYGVTKSDLETALELSKGLAISFLKNQDTGTEQVNELGEMIISGRIGRIYSETQCVLLESHRSMRKVRIIEGPMRGLERWVYKKSLGPAKIKERSGEFVIVLICFRYLVTAFICASFLYFLRIKSILSMIVCFVISMFILNLIVVKIISVLML
jgi:hypothetical protein